MTADLGSPELDRTELDWTEQGAPRSRRFDDIYFSAQDGLAETRTVFLEGCGLPGAWVGRPHFCVGELGFGTGLNVLALLDLWRRTRAPGQRLTIFSVEAFLLDGDQAARALQAWPELTDLAARLLERWPRAARGFHRIDFPEHGAVLDLAIGEAGWALDQWGGAADAWFLDGFSPAKNPQMWREEVLAAMAQKSASGARVASFTVAGFVRRALQAQGFAVEKRPGYGRKRERLEARLAGAPAARPEFRVAVIGAGIAGAALARALAAQGAAAVVLEADRPGAGASGNPAALVSAAIDAGGGARAAFYAQALARAADLYGALGPAAVIGRGTLQLEGVDRDSARFDKAIGAGLFAADRIRRLNGAEVAARLGEPQERGGLWFEDGLSVRPEAVLADWLAPARRVRARVATLERGNGVWRLLGADCETLAEAEAVVLAAGWGSVALWDTLPLSPVRGQASWAAASGLSTSASWGGYAIPFDDALLFGATHDRDREDVEPLQEDDHRNLRALAERLPGVAASVDVSRLKGRAGTRAVTPDRMPLAGPIPRQEGLYVLSGLGSRGFVTAPLLADHLAAVIAGAPSPLPADLQRIVDPGRFSTSHSP